MSRIVDELLDLLHNERRILLYGNLSDLNMLQTLKSSLFAKLGPQTGQSARELGELAKLAKRNLRLLDAAKKGIREARARFDPTSSDRVLTTYGIDGRKRSVPSAVGGFERRA
jgi:flagellar biosynthesis/type III secretory pathway chaperone